MGIDQRSHFIDSHRGILWVAVNLRDDVGLVELSDPPRREQGVSFAPRKTLTFLIVVP